MPKRKRGTALFDVLRGDEAVTSETLEVPQWWSKGDDASPQSVPDRATRVESGEIRRPGPAVSDCVTAVKVSGGPLVALDGDRIRISLTSVTGAVVVFAVALLGLAVFKLGSSSGFEQGYLKGRSSYEAAALTAIEAAKQAPPATYLLDGLLEDVEDVGDQVGQSFAETEISGSEPRSTGWIRDHTYVVAQEFRSGVLDDARRVGEFLAENGVSTELVRLPSGSIQLITTQGYSYNDPTQRQMAEQLKSEVHAIGARYYAAGGGYKLEGYFKTLKGDTW